MPVGTVIILPVYGKCVHLGESFDPDIKEARNLALLIINALFTQSLHIFESNTFP
jgi:hypothetical protein